MTMKKRSLKQRIVAATLALVMLLSSLLGTTFAWFTDSVTSGGNKIQSGNLEVDLLHKVKSDWVSLKEHTDHKIFDYDKWEPGYTRVETLKVANLGSLALKYKLSLEAAVGTAVLGKNGEKLSDVIDVYVLSGESNETSFEKIKTTWNYKGTLTQVLRNPTSFIEGELLPKGEDSSTVDVGSKTVSIALHMQESAGNEYQKLSVGDVYVNLIATQSSYENDSFGDKYDEDATFPELNIGGLDIPVNTEDGKTTEKTTASGEGVSATIPAGVAVEDGVDKLVLSVSEKEKSDANLTLEADEVLRPLDVHMEGVAEDNTKPMLIKIEKAMKVGLNIGNYTLYHVEDGVSNKMTAVASLSDLDAHNEYYYDPATGDVTLALATFSEVAMVVEPENAWKGNIDKELGGSGTAEDPYIISNADELAGMSQLVSEDTNGTGYAVAHYQLISDVNFGGEENTTNACVFYPVGYWKSLGTNNQGESYYGYSQSFMGVFDGNGNTISNIYQNTWLMDGDYDAGYYKAAMGIFGAVFNATIKNLTVQNFQSDGEFTPTGCVAAYAGGDSTFENISLIECNPRVYNTGNGGIVGLNYNSTEGIADQLVFKNITIDQTNKISALWGSYDVSCGGILGRLRENSKHDGTNTVGQKNTAHFENCHVAAIMDVNNDCCANYQYYQYRYSGMMIGTVDYIGDVPAVGVEDVITANDCTVTYGDWNEYWYCELVKNSPASYTHDHQFSRLTKIANVSDIQDENGNWNREGNFVIPASDNSSAECYHIFKNEEGNLYRHNHADSGYETKDVDGDSNGYNAEVGKYLLEDRQCYYIPFGQLFTGYGWGSSPVYTADAYENIDIEITDNNSDLTSQTKFESTGLNEIAENLVVNIGDLFKAKNGVSINTTNVKVFVSPVGYGSTVSAAYVSNTDWTKGTLTFSGTGSAKVVITDYFYCINTTLYVTVGGVETAYNKFETKFTGDFLYRVGNANTVSLGSLFKAKDGATIGDVEVTIEPVSGTVASGAYTSNATWTNGTIQFSGTGVVKVTITDNNYCTPTELYLEVVDAVNATTATSATANNVVLLNDIGSGFTVSGRYTVFGNGFTLNYTGNGQYLNNGLKQGVVTVSENGTLDNLRIVAPVYPKAYMYYGSAVLGEAVQSGPSSTETASDGTTKTRYHYQLSAVVAKGNATISNCYIYGGRTNIFVDTGDVTIKDTILECGTVANVQIQSNCSHTVTLENVTTIQYLVDSNVSGTTSAKMLGAGIIVGPETNDNPTIVLNGEFKQYNWVTADDKTAVSDEAAQKIIEGALNATEYNHNVNGRTASNLGIIYMNIYDANVTDNTGLPYEFGTVSISSANGKVYSLQNATESQIYSDYVNADKSTVNGLYEPQFKYESDLGGQYIAEGGDEYCFREGDTIKVLFPSGDTKELNLATLVNIVKYTGQDLGLVITCVDSNGNTTNVVDGKITLSNADEYTVTYTVTDTLFYDKDGNTVTQELTYSWDVTVSVSLKDTAIPNAYFEFDSSKQTMGYAKKSFLSGGNTQYLPFLAGLKIYDYNGQTSYLRFDGDNDFNKIAAAEITGYTSANHVLIKVTLTDGGVINIDTTARAASGGSTYTGKIQTSGNTIYYVNDGTTSATTTTWVISSYSFVGNNGVTIDSGSVTFSNCENGSVPTGSFGTTINYTVSYDANGGNCGQTTGYATSASTAVTLPTPTRSGYIFAGWYTAASGGEKVGGAGESYTPSANITLYAQWGQPCTVTYNANGGSCDTASEKYSGTALTLPTATRDGYWFAGWYNAADGGTKVGDAGATYKPDGDITLYAHWQEKIEYTVTYNANGGTCGTESATYQGTALTLPAPDARTGYAFKGWSDGTITYAAGASYIPSANITLTAQWEQISYTITISKQDNATVTVDKTTAHYNDTISVTVSFSQSRNKTFTVKNDTTGETILSYSAAGTYTFTMPASSVTIEASSSCVTGDTLVTLADGTQKRIDSLTGQEEILVWNFCTGEYEAAKISILINHGFDTVNITTLNFADGTSIKTINGHGFFDVATNEFVLIDEFNAADFVGHEFVKATETGYSTTTLVSYTVEEQYTEVWSILTAEHYNCILEGMWTVTAAEVDNSPEWLMPYEIGENMKYDEAAMKADIEKYGLYTYSDFADYMTEEQFVALGLANFKVSVGKGYITWDEILYLISIHIG